ncbi:MAG: hypothetical protein ACRDD8_11345 [Bacteroidales bacterium]
MQNALYYNFTATDFSDIPFTFHGYRAVIRKGDVSVRNFFHDSFLRGYSFVGQVTCYVEVDDCLDIRLLFLKSPHYHQNIYTSDKISFSIWESEDGDVTVYIHPKLDGYVKIEIHMQRDIDNFIGDCPFNLMYYPLNYYLYD